MKRLIVCGLFLLLGMATLQAKAPWGALPQVDADQPHTAVDDPLTILKKLTSGQPVKVYFEFEMAGEYYKDELRIGYMKALQSVADHWFQTVTVAIKQSKRSAQFPEVLKRLSHPAKMQIVSKEDEADLRVYVATTLKTVREKCNLEEALACVVTAYFTGKSPELIVRYGDEEFEFNLLHEWGHVLGLDDQYDDFVNSHPQYHSTNIYPSLMAGNVYGLNYDDVDGLINLIDIIYGTEPARANGWRSFVDGSRDVYVNGQLKGAGKYAFDWDIDGNVHLYTYENGKLVKEQKFPFVAADPFVRIPNKQVLGKDHLGRPVRAKGQTGEDVYYLYDYNISHRLIVKDGKAIRVESLEKKYKGENEYYWNIARDFFAGGQLMVLAMELTKDEGGSIAYGKIDVNTSQMSSALGYEIDKQGNISTEMGKEGNLSLTSEQMEKIGVQLRAWGKEQLQRIGFVPKPQVAQRAPQQKAKPQPAKPKASQNSAQYVRDQLSKQLKKK